MGMFDYVNCKMPLPDGFEIDPADPFQTKDFRYLYDWGTGGTMSTCTIEEDGTLTYKLNPQYDHSNIIFTPPPNNIDFYDLVQLDKFDWNDPNKLRRTLWVEYTAVIKDGKVIKIAMHPNHHAFEALPKTLENLKAIKEKNDKTDDKLNFDERLVKVEINFVKSGE